MAATVSIPVPQEAYQSVGSLFGAVIDVTLLTNEYVTGGIDFSAFLPGGRELVGAIVLKSEGTGSSTQIPAVDVVNKKLKLVKGTAGANAEVSNGTSDAQVIRLLTLSA